jgi:hypothetical protein
MIGWISTGRRRVRGELPEGILADVVLDGFVRALDGDGAGLGRRPGLGERLINALGYPVVTGVFDRPWVVPVETGPVSAFVVLPHDVDNRTLPM